MIPNNIDGGGEIHNEVHTGCIVGYYCLGFDIDIRHTGRLQRSRRTKSPGSYSSTNGAQDECFWLNLRLFFFVFPNQRFCRLSSADGGIQLIDVVQIGGFLYFGLIRPLDVKIRGGRFNRKTHVLSPDLVRQTLRLQILLVNANTSVDISTGSCDPDIGPDISRLIGLVR